jgi:non-canonical (house-cleaning) NTP pyrophosphatase
LLDGRRKENEMKIAIGSESAQKIGYLNEILKEIGVKAEIITCKVESGVSDQPLSEKETRTGSLNRAKRAFAKNPDADFAMGIEVGYHRNKSGRYEIFCCTSIVGKDDFSLSCNSHRFLLPKFHHEKLIKNEYLGHHTLEYHAKTKDTVKIYTGRILDDRNLLIKDSLRQALIQYLNRAEF